MKRNLIYTILSLMLLAGAITSCNKSVGPGPVSASFTVVNAIPSAAAVVINFNSNSTLQYYKTAQQVPIATSATPYYTFGGYIGDFPLGISQFTDTLHTLVKCNVHLDAGTAHTLVLTGSLAAPDTIFKSDDLTAITDSVVKVRFIDAAMGSVPVTVNIAGNQANPIATNVVYKASTKFIAIPAKKANLTYTTSTSTYSCTLEIRNATTSALITTCVLTPVIPIGTTSGAKLFKNVSVILKGTATAPTAVVVNHF
jgi:hypothetical protein